MSQQPERPLYDRNYRPPGHKPPRDENLAHEAIVLVVVIVVLLVVGLLGFRALSIAGEPGGGCMLTTQPSIIIGAAPSLTTELDCA